VARKRAPRIRIRGTLLLALLATGPARAAALQEHWYPAVPSARTDRLNVLVLTRDGEPWIRKLDLALLGLSAPAGPSLRRQVEAYVPLASVQQLRLDSVAGTLTVLETDTTAAAPEAVEKLVVDIVLNGRPLPDARLVRRAGDEVLIDLDTARALRLRPPGGDAAPGSAWLTLDTLVDGYRLDPDAATLSITTSVSRLQRTTLSARRRETTPPGPRRDDNPPVFSLSYDLLHARSSGGVHGSSGWFDAGLAWGRFQCLSQHAAATGTRPLRVASRCTTEWPERPLALTLGDAFSGDGALSRSVRFAGLHLGTDFSLQPDVPTYPQLTLEGSVDEAAQLEVWLRQRLALRSELPPGEYLVDGLTPMAGRGVLHSLATLADGSLHTFDVPYYFDPVLLRAGLDQWSLDAGLLRQHFGREDDRYAVPFAKAGWRRGITSGLTLALDSEWSDVHALLGLGARFKLAQVGVVELAAAGSHTGGGQAWARSASYSYRAPRWNLGLRHTRRRPGFVTLGNLQTEIPRAPDWLPRQALPLEETRVQAGFRLGPMSASLGLLSRLESKYGRDRYATASLGYALGGSFLNLNAYKDLDDGAGDTVTLTYTASLSPRQTLSAWAAPSLDGDGDRAGVTLQRSPDGRLGYGYRVGYQRLGERDAASFALDHRGQQVRTSVQGRYSDNGWSGTLGAAGTLVASGDGLFATGERSDSYALVTLPDAGVRVYRDRQLAAITGADGRALVAGLRPYQRNRLDVEAEDLSPSTVLDSAWTVVTPERGAISRVDFAARREYARDLRLLRQDGTPVPLGATATLLPGGAVSGIGYDGMLFLESADAVERIEVRWPGGACIAQPDPAAASAALPSLTCNDDHAQ